MKRSRRLCCLVLVGAISTGGLVLMGLWLRPRRTVGRIHTDGIIESRNPSSRFVLKPGAGHLDMHKYWRENLQYVLQFRREDNQKMTGSREHAAASCREAFLNWARRAAIPLPASPEEPLGERAQAALDQMLAGKRFAFLGEPDHFIVEKYPFRLLLTHYLLERGWRHVGMETGRSVGWRVDRYLETGDASCLSTEGAESPDPTDQAIHGKILEFVESLLAQVGDRFLLPLNNVDPPARTIPSRANVRLMEGSYASMDLTCQADAVYFVKDVNAL